MATSPPLPPPLLVLLATLATLSPLVAGQGGGISTERVDLYQGDVNLVHLDNNTFYDALLDQPNAWAMEFYKDWCGHCQRFEPIWSEVARRAKDWGAVVKVGAINCARRRNSAICREFGIHGVPQVRLFGPRVRRGEPGFAGIQHDPDKMMGVIVEFVTMMQRRQQPEGWPKLSEHSGSARQLLRNPEPLQALILEQMGRSMGRAVQLDLSSYQHLVRVSRTAHLPADLIEKPSSLPAMVLLRGDGSQELVTAPGEDPRALFSATIRRRIGVEDATPTVSTPTAAPAPTPAPTRAPADMVFMVDMENAIVVALKQEVITYNVIEGEALDALRGFLRVLLDLFPGRAHLMASLAQVLRSVSNTDSVSGETLERLLKSSSPWWPGLPELMPYQACRGSRPNYRGYSCSLWTLFHTLTVQELRNAPEGRNATVLPAVHGYVKHFFSCKHCSGHFQKMAAEDGLFDVYTPQDSLLWLWRAHNKVNNRIAGDVTEDPLHPKRQFPDTKLCPECFDQEAGRGIYDEFEVMEYLMQFYAVENFRGEGLDPVPVANLPSGGGHHHDDDAGQPRGDVLSASDERTRLSSHAQDDEHGHRSSAGHGLRSPAVGSVSRRPVGTSTSDLDSSESVRSVLSQRIPHLRRRLPPPAVLPPQPGHPEVVPGIMRYPSEMAHVFPTVVRASPAEESEVTPTHGSGLSRTQRRVAYVRPRVVYSQPRVVYTQPRVVYTQPRVVYTRPRVVYARPPGTPSFYSQDVAEHRGFEAARHVQDASRITPSALVTPAFDTPRQRHSVRTYWPGDVPY